MIDWWLLDEPSEHVRGMLLELLEPRYYSFRTGFCTQYAKKDWHHSLGVDVHADAITDRVVHRAVWIETGNANLREYAASTRR